MDGVGGIPKKTEFVTVGATSFDTLVKTADSEQVNTELFKKGYANLLIQMGRGSHIAPKFSGEEGSLAVDSFTFSPSIAVYLKTLTDNMVVGVSKGFEKRLQLVGVSHRAMLEGRDLVLSTRFSHPVRMAIPDGLKVKVEENTRIVVNSYEGKGVRYADEVVRRKEGKAGEKK